MILFHAKANGQVTTTPSLVPQGSSMQDLVVLSELDYALCTIKLEPASGIEIPDVVCTFIKTERGTTVWTAKLPPEAAKVAGKVTYSLEFTAADGTVQPTLSGSFTVPRRAKTTIPENVDGLKQYTVNELFALLSDIYASMTGSDAEIALLLTRLTTSGTFTIPPTEWTDQAPHQALVNVGSEAFSKGCVVLVAPENDATKEAAGAARMSIDIDDVVDGEGTFMDYVMVARAESGEAPTIPLNFRYIVLKTGTEEKALVAMIGVDAVGEGVTGGSGGTTSGVDEAAVRNIINQVVPAWARASTKPTYTKDEVGLGNVDNVKQYSDSNKPDYPVDSVNGKTGAVKLSADDVGARSSSWMPTAAQVGADPSGTAATKVSDHDTYTGSHNDIRLMIKALQAQVNKFLDVDDTTRDELSEVLALIDANAGTLESITNAKVNVSDIINNLTTNVTNKPLSAAQGVVLKALIDALSTSKLDASELTSAINTALAQAKASGDFKGDPGTSVTIKSISESDESGGENVVTFSDGKTMKVKNGKDFQFGENENETVTTTETVRYAPSGGEGDVLCGKQSGMIDLSGVYLETGAFDCTSNIPIDPKTTTISVNIISYTTVSAVAFYNVNGQFISGISAPETNRTWQRGEIEIPDDAKSVRFTFLYNESNDSQYAVVTKTETTIAGATTKTTRYTNSGDTSGDVEATVFGFIDKNGVYMESGGYHCIQYIPIDAPNTKISVNLRGYTSFFNVVFYTSAKALISGVSVNSNGGYITGDMEIPGNAAYVGFTFTDSGTGQYAEVSITTYEKASAQDMFYEKTYLDFNGIVDNQVETGYLRATDGVVESSGTGSASPFISVNVACVINFLLYGNANFAPLVFYDKHQKFLSAINVSSASFHEMKGIVPPEKAFYMRYAANTATSGYKNQYIEIKRTLIRSNNLEIKRLIGSNPLYGKILTATGDSITATVSNRQYASYARIIAADNCMTYECKAIWGATIASGVSGSSGCILDTLSSMRSDADYVILSGGANDFYALAGGTETLGTISSGYYASLDTTTFCGAVESLCKTAIDKWKGKKILFVITHRMLDISAQDTLQTHVATLIQILEKWGIPYVDLWHDMPSLAYGDLKNLYTSNGNTVYEGVGDGLHPNEEGYRLYYVPRVEAKLKAI